MTNNNIIIVLEGIDGCGKTYLTKRLVDHYKSLGLRTMYLHFPQEDGTYGRIIYDHLRNKKDFNEMDPYAQYLLYALDRYEFFRTHKFEEPTIIIADRWSTSSMIYQTAGFITNAINKNIIYQDIIYTDTVDISGDELEEYKFTFPNISDYYIERIMDSKVTLPNIPFETVRYFNKMIKLEDTCLSVPKPDIVFYIDAKNRTNKSIIERRKSSSIDSFESDLQFISILQRVGECMARSSEWIIINNEEGSDAFDTIVNGYMESSDSKFNLMNFVKFISKTPNE